MFEETFPKGDVKTSTSDLKVNLVLLPCPFLGTRLWNSTIGKGRQVAHPRASCELGMDTNELGGCH